MAHIPWLFALLPLLPALNIAHDLDLSSIRVLVPLAGLWVVVLGVKKKKLFIPTAASFLAWSAFVVTATVSLFWAHESAFTLRKTLFFLSLLPIGLIIVNVPENVRKRILSMFVVGAVASAFIALFFFFGQFVIGAESITNILLGRTAEVFFGSNTADAVRSFPSWFVDIGDGESLLRATFPFPNPHTAALFWGMGLALLIANNKLQILKIFSERTHRFLLYSMRYTLLAALLATFSRGAYVSLFALFIVYGLWHIAAKRKDVMRYTFITAGSSVLIITALVLIAPSLFDRFLSTWDIGEGSNSARIALWYDARNIFFSSPVLGTGLGNFASTLAPSAAYRDPTNAHSTYFEIAAELGLIGLFFFLFALLGGIKAAVSARQPAIVLALLFFSIHALFETNLYYPANHVVFLTLLTLAGFPSVQRISNPSRINE